MTDKEAVKIVQGLVKVSLAVIALVAFLILRFVDLGELWPVLPSMVLLSIAIVFYAAFDALNEWRRRNPEN